jgi:steroid delta-isomerase-like uncharacterized protein
MNAGRYEVLDELCTAELAPKLASAFASFRTAFPDWHQEIIELVADHRTVAARFRCSGTHLAMWRGLPATGRRMRIDEVYFFRFDGGRLRSLWGLEDTWSRMQQLAGDSGATLGELGSLS